MSEINEVIEKLGKEFGEFQKANAERLDEIEKSGKADPLLSEKVDKMAASLADLSTAKDNAEASAKAAQEQIDALEEQVNAPHFDGKSINADKLKSAREEYVRKGDGAALEAINAPQVKSLNLSNDSDGGVFYSVTQDPNMVDLVTETSPMRQCARVVNISTSAYEVARKTGVSTTSWRTELESTSNTTTPSVGLKRIETHEQYAQALATTKVLNDTAFDIEGWLNADIAEQQAVAQNTAFITGNGVDRPRGFLDYTASASPGTEELEFTASGASGAWAGSNPHLNLITCAYSLKAAYRAGAKWMMSKARVAEVMKFVDGDGNLIWSPGLAAGEPSTLLGYGIVEAEDMPALAANSLSVAFGDFMQGYTIVDRQGVTILRDPYTNKGYITLFVTSRVGGDVVNHDAIKVIKFAA